MKLKVKLGRILFWTNVSLGFEYLNYLIQRNQLLQEKNRNTKLLAHFILFYFVLFLFIYLLIFLTLNLLMNSDLYAISGLQHIIKFIRKNVKKRNNFGVADVNAIIFFVYTEFSGIQEIWHCFTARSCDLF